MNEQLIARLRDYDDCDPDGRYCIAHRDAVEAAAAALEAVPPREPTPEMLRVGDQVLGYSELDGEEAIREAWHAMWDVAPKGQP